MVVFGPYEPPTALAAPPPSSGGGWFQGILGGLGGGVGSLLQQGAAYYQQEQAASAARTAERQAAKREYELERLRLMNQAQAPPAITPKSPVALGSFTPQSGGLAAGVNPTLLLIGLGLFAGAAALKLFGRR